MNTYANANQKKEVKMGTKTFITDHKNLPGVQDILMA